jgi:hypothetical protein
MKTGDDESGVIDNTEEQHVREPAQQRAAQIGESDGKLKRICGYALRGVVELSAKATPQTSGFAFVPVLRIACFGLRCR